MRITKSFLREFIKENLNTLLEGLSSSRYWAIRNMARNAGKPKEEPESEEDKKDKESDKSNKKDKKQS